MRYRSFKITNFRGIKSATVELSPAGAGIFTFIGLNESGKTTALEAISTFQIRGGDEQSLYRVKPTKADPATWMPKHDKATFTGEISVTATIEFGEGDKEACIREAEAASGAKINRDTVPDTFTVRRGYTFENGDQKDRINQWSLGLLAKKKGARKFTGVITGDVAWVRFSTAVAKRLPEIVYFPTFIFEQPERIILNPQDNEENVDRLYRNIIENVGRSLDRPIEIETNIVDRIIKPETPGESFAGFFSLSNNRKQQIDSAINQMSENLSDTIFGSWTKIFGNSVAGRQIILSPGVDKHPDGSPRVYLQISIKDGNQQYDIGERSLGFRWFFSFLLFTLYRNVATGTKKTLFLLDEPASNLHARAQMQLLDSFPRIASDGSMIMYSTHSHYMINPEWLDQAYIVSNSAIDYDEAENLSSGRRLKTEISVQKYRNFVGSNPDKATYFQPVLDRLQIVPSRLDALRPCVLVEGKGDYLILQYGLFLTGNITDTYSVVPTRGAEHFDELVGILLGWGVNFAMCFDDDTPGRRVCKDFQENWGIKKEKCFTLRSLDEELEGKSIESLLTSEDLNLISDHYTIKGKPTKSQIQLFFSEKLSLREELNLSSNFKSRVEAFDATVREALDLRP